MENNATEINASMVTIEVTDEKTGAKYRRELPIDYYETANCLRLKGEGLNGAPAELVFYSNRGVERLKNLAGKGPDEDSCGSHS
ncbi:MAG: hypothetical protein EOM54_09125 [Clostridia bacterium]|nr:hypothetical protein [Clostridia bacterium]NCC68278.1 hypothetical protein [Clostridia bacterium]